MKKIWIFVLLASFSYSCSPTAETRDDKVRFVFDKGALKFVASSYNPTLETMSIVYGNKQATAFLTDGQAPQAVVKVVRWKVQDSPSYFGSKVNGELLSVETLTTDTIGAITYGVDFGKLNDDSSKEKRIKAISSFKPVQFPSQSN